MKGLTQTAYAKRRGVSVPYVNKLYHGGRLKVNDDGTIDADASDVMLQRSSDPTRGGDGGGGALSRAMAAEQAPAASAQADPPPAVSDRMSLTDAKTLSAVYRAKLDEVEYRKSINELIEAARSDAGIADAFAIVGRALEQMADRMAARMAAETDPRRMHALLVAEFDAVRAEIADAIENLPETLTATRQ